jgi:hypothetical protein
MNTVENTSKESATIINFNYREMVDFKGMVVVCHPLRRQLSEITIDLPVQNINVKTENHDENNKINKDILPFKYCSSEEQRRVPIFMSAPDRSMVIPTTKKSIQSSTLAINGSELRKQSIDLLSQCLPNRVTTLSSVNVCFSKLLQKTDSTKSDTSPKMPTRVKTIISLQKLAATPL